MKSWQGLAKRIALAMALILALSEVNPLRRVRAAGLWEGAAAALEQVGLNGEELREQGKQETGAGAGSEGEAPVMEREAGEGEFEEQAAIVGEDEVSAGRRKRSLCWRMGAVCWCCTGRACTTRKAGNGRKSTTGSARKPGR